MGFGVMNAFILVESQAEVVLVIYPDTLILTLSFYVDRLDTDNQMHNSTG